LHRAKAADEAESEAADAEHQPPRAGTVMLRGAKADGGLGDVWGSRPS